MPEFIFTDVDSVQIENSSRNIGASINELSSINSFFRSNVMPCLSPCWCGYAKQNFERQFIAFSDMFEKLVESYKELNERLTYAGTSYNKANTSVEQFIAKLPN